MQLHSDKKEVTVGGAKSTNEFSMKMNAKAFRVLSDGMYKNKIGSLVREICCNAKDAHTQAGKTDVPFTVHLPDHLEPWFAVEDYGVGLSPEQISQVYCTFFESTKDQSNDQVGAFGLGSKTPFAYDESFTVTSVFDGMEYHYAAYLDGEGMPSISLMSENETDKPNGLTVKIAAKREDFETFRKEVAKQLRYFSVKPNIHNCGHFEFDNLREAAMTIGSVEILNGDQWNERITIIQGDVGYPLDIPEIKDHLSDGNFPIIKMLKESSARITFDIGQINVTASREGVEYNKATIANIDAKITEFREQMQDELNNILSKEDNDWNRALVLNGNSTLAKIAGQMDYEIPNAYRVGGEWKFNAGDYFGETVEIEHKMEDGTIRQRKQFKRYYKIVMYRKNNSGNITMKTSKDVDSLKVEKDIEHLYYRDTSKQPVARIKHEMIENDMDRMFVVCIGPDHDKTVTTAFTTKVLKEISESFGGLPTQAISKLEKPPAPIRNNTNYDKPIAYQIKPENAHWLRRFQDSTYDWGRAYGTLEDLEPSVYVECDRYAIESASYKDFDKMYALIVCGLSDVTVYGFNRMNTEKIKQIDGWIPLSEYVEQEYPKVEPMFDEYRALARLHILHDKFYRIMDSDNLKKLYDLRSMLDKGTIGEWYIKSQHTVVKAFDYYLAKLDDKQKTFYEQFGSRIREDVKEDMKQNDPIWDKLKKAKNMFMLIPSGWSTLKDDKLEHIIQYVNCMSKGA